MITPTRSAAPQFIASRRALLGKAVLAAALIAAPAAFAQSKGASGKDAPAKDAPSKDASASGGGKEYTVVMSNMDFGALPSGLKVGDTVVWVNHDTVIHSVTARDKSFDLRINPGQSQKLTLMTAGKFAYYCLFHPTMRGTMTVAAK
ncbi:MAG TPA: cupredoxin domain-containing protein [Caulobacteraceae bacterium]